MDLQRNTHRFCTIVQFSRVVTFFTILGLLSSPPVAAQSPAPRPPELIRDTDVADNTDVSVVKEPDPALSEKSLSIGDFYFKRKNYEAAIGRYIEAIEYQPGSHRAYDALARAYEKNANPDKAIETYRQFIEKNPNSPKRAEFQGKIARLEKSR